jgi:hypothetical protein
MSLFGEPQIQRDLSSIANFVRIKNMENLIIGIFWFLEFAVRPKRSAGTLPQANVYSAQ